jgi:hypothetical protein
MFWGMYDVLWWIILALLALTGVLARMGLHLFNRESILGREIDTLNLRLAWTGFTQAFRCDARGPLDWYRGILRQTLPRMRMPLLVQCGAIVAAYLIGQSQAARFPLPAEMLRMGQLEGSAAEELLRFGMLNGSGWMWVISNNLRAMGLATLLGAFSFGVASIVLNMAPMAIIGYFAGNVAMAGQGVFKFLLALVIPHAILEIPAAILGGAAMIRLGMVIVSPPQGRSLGQNWVIALADWARVFVGLVVPLLIGAAALEVFVTPRVALLLLHG